MKTTGRLLRSAALLWVFFGLFLACGLLRAEPDPDRHWLSAETPHLRLHYVAEQRALAERVAVLAERIYQRHTQELAWVPQDKIDIVLDDSMDLSNGLTTPLPFNKIFLYPAPPQLDAQLLTNSEWMEMLVTHEMWHSIHLDKVRGIGAGIRRIFGRLAVSMPNVFQPNWVLEGMATYIESQPQLGRGRLKGPYFDAWLRAERARGFQSLDELNANGRALPTSKNYLYGAYFFDFLVRRYGRQAIAQFVHFASGQFALWPHFQGNGLAVSGLTMDRLWADFLVDLGAYADASAAAAQGIEERAANDRPKDPKDRPAKAETLLQAQLAIYALAAHPQQALSYAVVNDGWGAPQLLQMQAGQTPRALAGLNGFAAQMDLSPSGRLLIAQPEVCRVHYMLFDLYEWSEKEGLQRLTECGRYRQAVWWGEQHIMALQHEAGQTRLVRLKNEQNQWRFEQSLYASGEGEELVSLAAWGTTHVVLLSKKQGRWRLLLLGAQQLQQSPQQDKPLLLWEGSEPVLGLRLIDVQTDTHSDANGAAQANSNSNTQAQRLVLQMLASHQGVFNVWQVEFKPAAPSITTIASTPVDSAPSWVASSWQRMSQTSMGVLAFSGADAKGEHTLALVAPQGVALQREAMQVQGVLPTGPGRTMPSAPKAEASASTADLALGPARDYAAGSSLRPRSWFPTWIVDQGLSAYGLSTLGADVMDWHQYVLTAMWEPRQKEFIGSMQYLYHERHFLSYVQQLEATSWNGDKDVVSYQRASKWQAWSTWPWLRIEQRARWGLGAARETIDQIVVNGATDALRQEKVLALLLEYDSRRSNWFSEPANRGYRATLRYEDGKALNSDQPGSVIRLDQDKHFEWGQSTLALSWTEARAQGRTRPYQLGGAVSLPSLMPEINQRRLNLRGYVGNESELSGTNARRLSLEWSTPLWDVDRHAMQIPVGVNRISGSAFLDAGAAWSEGSGPQQYQRSVGFETRSELRLAYAVPLLFRLGVARALDGARGFAVYAQLMGLN